MKKLSIPIKLETSRAESPRGSSLYDVDELQRSEDDWKPTSTRFRAIILMAAISQMALAALAYILFCYEFQGYIFFPNWGPLPLQNQPAIEIWLLVEYLFGLSLIVISTRYPSWLALTLWMWAALILTYTSFIRFLWELPKLRLTDPTIVCIFLIQFFYHLSLTALTRVYYTKTFKIWKDNPEEYIV